jgi:hypothetical protein
MEPADDAPPPCAPADGAVGFGMLKRPSSIRNPDQEPDPNKLDVIRKLTGGETPAKALARVEAEQRSRAARILGRAGGRKGGRQRAKNLSAERRSEIASKAARARWKNR